MPRTRPKPKSPGSSKKLLQGKLQQSTLPPPLYGRNKPCAKMTLYCHPKDLVGIMAAIRDVKSSDLIGVDPTGTENGRAIAAVCKQWLKERGK